MRIIGTWLLRAFFALLLAAIVLGLWNRDQIRRLWAVNSLFDAEHIVENFSHMDLAFLHVPLPRGEGPISPLPEGPRAVLPDSVVSWQDERSVTSLLVLKDATIRHEDYQLGTGPDDLRIGWSLSKSFLSALAGTVVAEGAIASLDDPVTDYAPALRGTAYDGATVRNVLNMATGVTFDEDYLDYDSDINRMGRVLALGGTMDGFAAGLSETFAEPGSAWQYVSIDTHVLGMVIRGAAGRSVVDLMRERIVEPLGLEGEPFYLTDGTGTAFVLGGLNLTTRDYARFGQMVLQGGAWQGRQIVPADWLEEATTASAPTEPGRYGYGYQWWIPPGAQPGEYLARGIYGQYIYFNEIDNVVIVVTAADRSFREPGVDAGNIEMFRLISGSL
ncbi:serine hydrolase [Sulfitobacter sp. D35]|uniref:serine hydrolase domain-containing protein n=1 Tax=Sulfitobacter sp. D35 TaxID=3083252 RepID=UPI00296F4EF2|nr:serine hydrolase [Sulfitobacter sp. D35]MDW4498665.1 serine hydrolase [Sulfitobacter sp. D35]